MVGPISSSQQQLIHTGQKYVMQCYLANSPLIDLILLSVSSMQKWQL